MKWVLIVWIGFATGVMAQVGMDEGLYTSAGPTPRPVDEAPPPPPDAVDPFLAEIEAEQAAKAKDAPLEPEAPAPEETPPNAPLVTRDPFWPVAYEPPPPPQKKADSVVSTTNEPPDNAPSATLLWEDALKTVEVRGIMKTGAGTYVAMVNGVVSSAGDRVAIQYKNRPYEWRIAAISERGVSFARVEPPAAEEASPPTNGNTPARPDD